MDAPSGWTNISFSLAVNADWRTYTNIFDVTPTGDVYLKQNLTFDAMADYEWFNGRKARRVFTFVVSVCDADTPPLCTNATARGAVLATNDTM